MRKKLAVLFGGCSPEYPISLQSAHAVISHLDPERYELFPLGITKDGHWLLYTGPLAAIPADTWHQDKAHCTPALISPDRILHGLLILSGVGPSSVSLDAAFPVLHGCNGEDGTIQGLLELAGIPIVGCSTLSSAICMDKDIAHRLAAEAGLHVPSSLIFRRGQDLGNLPARLTDFTYPIFVKPARAGSSFGIGRVSSPDDLSAAVNTALEYDSKLVLEEAVPGFEVGCAVLGRHGKLTVGRVDQIDLTGGFFDYTEKYNLLTAQIRLPCSLTFSQEQAVQAAARRVYETLNCDGMARVDFFFTPEGTLVFNEANTIPGFTAHSRYPRMMELAGLSLPALLDTLVDAAVAP